MAAVKKPRDLVKGKAGRAGIKVALGPPKKRGAARLAGKRAAGAGGSAG